MRYLSTEWIAAANDAVVSAGSTAPVDTVIIDQHVADAVSYRVHIEQGACHIEVLPGDATPGDESPADAVFQQSLATARAVAEGTTDAHQAFLLGHITFVGAIDVLIERREALNWLQSTLAPLMQETTFS